MSRGWEEELSQLSHKDLLNIAKTFSATTTVINDFIPKSAEGCTLTGWDGKKYLDFTSGVGCNNLGYNHPAIKAAIARQLDRGILNFPDNDWHNPWATLLKKKLCEITPGRFPKKVFLSNSGAEAVEAAIKMCIKRRAQNKEYRRDIFINFMGAFHGRTLGALSLNASKPVHTRDYPKAIAVHSLPFPNNGKNPDAVLKCFESELSDIGPGRINAIFLELIQGEGGINIIDWSVLKRIDAMARDAGIYIVADEVQTGMMRTGKMFACKYHHGFEPDIICLGKGLGSGMPIGATVAREEFDFPEKGCHSNTFGGNALASVAALETISVLESLDADEIYGKIILLNSFSESGIGFMHRVVFENQNERNAVIETAFKQGLILLGAGQKNIRLMPPPIISKEELVRGLSIVDECRKKIPVRNS